MSNSVTNSQLSRTESLGWVARVAISNSVISNTPPSGSNRFSLPSAQITSAISNFITFRRNTGQQSGSAVKTPPDKDVLKAENYELMCSDGNESKVRLTGLTAANAEGDKLPVFVKFSDQTITPEVWGQPRQSRSPAIFNTSQYNPWEFERFDCIFSDTHSTFWQYAL